MIHDISILTKPFSDPLCSVDWGIDILEETTPTRLEMSHHRKKVLPQNHFILICGDLSLTGDKWVLNHATKMPPTAQHSSPLIYTGFFLSFVPRLYVLAFTIIL